MDFQKKHNLLYSILSGILLILAFPPLPFPFLAFIALTPLLFIYSRETRTKSPFLYVYITFFLYHLGTNWWISSWSKETDPYLLIAGLALDISHPLFFFIPFWIFFIFKKKLGFDKAILFFPFIYLAFEWLHSLGEIGYGWLTLGYMQILNTWWIQFIDITGIWGASFLLLWANVFFVKLILLIINSPNKSFFKLLLSNKTATNYLLGILLILFLPYFYSFFAIKQFNYQDNLSKYQSLNVGIVQPNINPWAKWSGNSVSQITLHQHISDSLINTHQSNQKESLDLLIWSETAIPYVYLEFNSFDDLSILQNWINKRQIPLLTGFSQFYLFPKNSTHSKWASQLRFDTAQYYLTYNSAVIIEPDKHYSRNNPPQVYQKTRLTPFAENFPYKNIFTFAVSWFNWEVGISNWEQGGGAKNMIVRKGNDSINIGTIICIESIYPDYVRQFTKQGAKMLTIITNDGWYDHTVGPRQHYLIACARAIENRRYIPRVANTGVSGLISPLGKSITEIEPYTRKAVEVRVPLLNEGTFYVQFGDWLPILSFIIVIILLIFINLKNTFK